MLILCLSYFIIKMYILWFEWTSWNSNLEFTLLSFPSKWRSWFFFLSFAFLNISFPKSETRTGSNVRSWELHSIIIAFEEFKVFCTGYLFLLSHCLSQNFASTNVNTKLKHGHWAWGLSALQPALQPTQNQQSFDLNNEKVKMNNL